MSSSRMPGVEITYLVDPDTRTFKKRLDQIAKKGAARRPPFKTSAACSRIRTVDAISVATPNHWHALLTIWGCQAGKDVYVEKPCSHNVHEGRIAVEAARRYNRIVQHGTQSRSSHDWALAAAAIQSGKLGKLLVSRALCYKPRGSIGVKPITTPPEQLAFDIWLGPGPATAVSRQPGPLQLALVLGLRQRRYRQPGRPSDGHRTLADPGRQLERAWRQRDFPQDRHEPGRPVRLS